MRARARSSESDPRDPLVDWYEYLITSSHAYIQPIVLIDDTTFRMYDKKVATTIGLSEVGPGWYGFLKTSSHASIQAAT